MAAPEVVAAGSSPLTRGKLMPRLDEGTDAGSSPLTRGKHCHHRV